eukprot:1703885-Pleurochrysis_carterae.AAC.1
MERAPVVPPKCAFLSPRTSTATALAAALVKADHALPSFVLVQEPAHVYIHTRMSARVRGCMRAGPPMRRRRTDARASARVRQSDRLRDGQGAADVYDYPARSTHALLRASI